MVLRAVVAAYVADANPASSTTVSHLLPVPLSTASIRNTMAELASLDLLEKPHASAGRIPTEGGLRIFLDHLFEAHSLSAYDQRALADEIDHVEGDMMPGLATLLSLRTHQLGFALRPRLDRLTLRHLSLVRVAENKLLVVVVPKAEVPPAAAAAPEYPRRRCGASSPRNASLPSSPSREDGRAR